jgi:hypothetical protein
LSDFCGEQDPFALVLGSKIPAETRFERTIAGCAVLVLTCHYQPRLVVQSEVRRSKFSEPLRLGLPD